MAIYFDHNATTQVRPDVIARVSEIMAAVGNPSSVHAHGQAARRHVERAREQVGKALCARAEDVIFTGGGTEALNLAINSVIAAGHRKIIMSAIEHEAVAETLKAADIAVVTWPVNAQGVVEIAALDDLLRDWDAVADGTPVLALMLANNEIGTIQPVAEAAQRIRALDGRVIVDAVQSAGKIPVDFAALGADYMAISAHKFGGPQGVGALIAACDARVARHSHGGGQEKGRRAGTLNVAGIAGLGLALEQAVAELDRFADLAVERDRIIAAIKTAAPGVRILGEGADRLPNTIALAIAGWPGATQVMALDLAGMSISAGAACSSGRAKASKMGTALDLPAEMADGVTRISLGWTTKQTDVDALIEAWTTAWARVAPQLAPMA